MLQLIVQHDAAQLTVEELGEQASGSEECQQWSAVVSMLNDLCRRALSCSSTSTMASPHSSAISWPKLGGKPAPFVLVVGD